MKKLKYIVYLLSFVVLFSSCSNDDGPGPSAQNNKVGLFAEDARPITVPEAMQASNDEHAIMANMYIGLSTTFSSFAYLFEVPEGATKRNQPITASNARIAADGYTVYEWLGPDGSAIAYQYSEQGNQEVFEIFMREGNKDYFKWYEVTQNKDGKKGTLKWFGDTGIAMQWTWEIKADESYHVNFISEDFRYEIVSNKDLSGNIKTYSEGKLTGEISWDNIGNGWWKEYDGNNVVDEGSWDVQS